MACRYYTGRDRVLIRVERCLRSFAEVLAPVAHRDSPAVQVEASVLSLDEQQYSARLMRINHAGEVCAQALYLGQSLTARDPLLADRLKQAAQEEVDHLSWCDMRLRELNASKSYLNPVLFVGSVAIGCFAGAWGDQWSLGFLAETERQVYTHLSRHLERLPKNDYKSRAILLTMREEEQQHATTAVQLGAAELPIPTRLIMRLFSKIMVTLTFWV